MTDTHTKLRLFSGEGVDLQPGSDWPSFAKDFLHPMDDTEFLSLGQHIGYIIITETGSSDPEIVRAIAGRFSAAIDLEVRHMDRENEEFMKGVSAAVVLERALRGEA
jgi:hypothetical protein